MNSFSQNDCAQIDINFTGFCSEFHSNGKTKWVKAFQNGQAVGIWMFFDEQANLKKQLNTNLKRDSLDKIYEETFHIDLKDTKIFEFVDQDASFKGNMLEYIHKNLVFRNCFNYDIGLGSKIYVKFIVEKDGSSSQVTIIRGLNDEPECRKDLVKMFEAMPKWLPAKNGGKTVRSWVQIPINICFK